MSDDKRSMQASLARWRPCTRQSTLGREVNPMVFDVDYSAQRRLRAGAHLRGSAPESSSS